MNIFSQLGKNLVPETRLSFVQGKSRVADCQKNIKLRSARRNTGLTTPGKNVNPKKKHRRNKNDQPASPLMYQFWKLSSSMEIHCFEA